MPVANAPGRSSGHVIVPGVVVENACLCDAHFRITFRVDDFPESRPGHFLHLGPPLPGEVAASSAVSGPGTATGSGDQPFLRRAFSIAGLRRTKGGVELDVIYRVVGRSTGWLANLGPGDLASILGPQGNCFPMEPRRRLAWLVAGGVGLPPLLWLAEALKSSSKDAVLFYGAQGVNLAALRMDPARPPATDACSAVLSANELAAVGVPVVISTDDGSLGFHGHVGRALETYWKSNPVSPEELVLYTCGPERMMHFVAQFAERTGALCYACVERSMACATGMCQSCVVPVHDPADRDGWHYELCCTDGPVFDSRQVIWDFDSFLQSRGRSAASGPAFPLA